MKNKIRNIFLTLLLLVATACIGFACTTEIVKNPVPNQLPDTEVETFAPGGIPDYEWEHEAAFGEKPDLDIVIDGKMGNEEGWEEQEFYETSTTSVPTVSYKLTTQFSPKGLYVFASARDNNGVYWVDKNYMYTNTNFRFFITDEATTSYSNAYVRIVQIDTNNVYPTQTRVKAASAVVEGEVNTSESVRAATFNVEMFITWDELGIKVQDGQLPQGVKIFTVYNYKSNYGDTLTKQLYAPYSTKSSELVNYIKFNQNGYAMADAANAVLGSSANNVAKSVGWDISHEQDAEPYVTTNATGNQVIFFKQVSGGNYVVEAEIVPTLGGSTSGKAGLVLYLSPTVYSQFLVDINETTYVDGAFTSVKTTTRTTDKDGNAVTTAFDPMVPVDGKVSLKIVYASPYVYYIANEKLVNCMLLVDLTERAVPGLTTIGAKGVKFKNYFGSDEYTGSSIAEESGKYAYTISNDKLKNVTITYDTVGVPTDAATNVANMTIKHTAVALNNTIRDDLAENNYESIAKKINVISDIYKSVNKGEPVSFIDDFLANAKYGAYPLRNITGNTVISNASATIYDLNMTEELVQITGRILDPETGKNLRKAVNVAITSNNPRLSNYEMTVRQGDDILLVVPRGYDYRLVFTVSGYRTFSKEVSVPATQKQDEHIDLGDYTATANIIGGIVYDEEGNHFANSTSATWDFSTESDGYVTFETSQYGGGTAFFSGKTASEYQYATLKITNTTDRFSNSVYEPDPAAGFHIQDSSGVKSFIGLRQGGIRYLPNAAVWAPTQYGGYKNQTVARLPEADGTTYSNTISMLRIKATCYIYIDGEYFCTIVTPREGVAAVGVFVTSSYYMSMVFSDYSIIVGKEKVLAFAAEKVAIQPVLQGTAANKKLISFGGLEGNVALQGSSFDVKLDTEKADSDKAYEVEVQGIGKVLLTKASPVATLKVPSGAVGKVNAIIRNKDVGKIKGVATIGGKPATEALAGTIKTDSSEIKFTTAEDGSFEVSVPSGSYYYSVYVEKQGYACKSVGTDAPATGATVTLASNVELHDSLFGPKGPAGTTYNSHGDAVTGYDAIIGNTQISGQYLEVDTTNGDNSQYFDNQTFDNFVLKYRYYRVQEDNHETDPGVGLRVYSGTSHESILFYQTGVRIFGGGLDWANRSEKTGIMSNDVRTFGQEMDFMIIRKDTMYLMYAKTPAETEYNLIHQHVSSSGFGNVAVAIHSTNTDGKHNHYYIYNVEMLTDSESLINELKVDVTDNSATVANGSFTVSGGITIEGEKIYQINDMLTVKMTPDQGYVPAYVKVNGELYEVKNNEVKFVLTGNATIEVAFEEAYETVTATGKVVTNGDFDYKPSSATIVAVMDDGRVITTNGVKIADDGSFNIAIRVGSFKFYAEAGNYISKATEATLSTSATTIGDMTLASFRMSDSVGVNGNTLNSVKGLINDDLLTEGIVRVPDRGGNSYMAYSDAAIADVSADFYFGTNLIMSGDATSKYYTPDNVTGIIFSSGARNLAIKFLNTGFRITEGGWNQKAMIEVSGLTTQSYYDPGRKQDESHKLAGHWNATTKQLNVYVDDVLVMVMDATNGVSFPGTGSVSNYAGNLDNIKSVVADVFGAKEVACGFCVNINMAVAGVRNNSGFKDTVFTNKAERVAYYTQQA